MTYNIDRSNTDQFYRYKMPRLIAKVGRTTNDTDSRFIFTNSTFSRLRAQATASRLSSLTSPISPDLWNVPQLVRNTHSQYCLTLFSFSHFLLRIVCNLWSRCLFVDPLKYFGYELGAQTMIDAKNERYIVNGSHEAVRLQEMLDGFIKKFVLCPNCNNPETRLVTFFLASFLSEV